MVKIGKILILSDLTREYVPNWTTKRQFPFFMNLHHSQSSDLIGPWALLHYHVRSLYRNASPPHTVLAVVVGQWRTNWLHRAQPKRPVAKWLHRNNAADTIRTNLRPLGPLHPRIDWYQLLRVVNVQRVVCCHRFHTLHLPTTVLLLVQVPWYQLVQKLLVFWKEE